MENSHPTPGRNGTSLLRLSGRLEFSERRPVIRAMEQWLHLEQSTTLEVDCSDITYVDTAGLALLMLMHERAQQFGRQITLSHCSKAVRDLTLDQRFRDLFSIS